MFEPKRGISTLRICLIVSALASLMFRPAIAQSSDLPIVPPEQSITDGIFDSGQSGMLLWATTEKFCNRLKAVSSTGFGSETTLFYANEAQTQFYEGTCAGNCSL
jgi:hypothetical protein